MLVGRDYERKKNIYWQVIYNENTNIYRQARQWLERQGYVLTAVVIDGKKGVQTVFHDIPVQLCQFHQIAAVNRYLTRRPKLEAGKELRIIALSLTRTNLEKFMIDLEEWHGEWEGFLKQKTSNLNRTPKSGHGVKN